MYEIDEITQGVSVQLTPDKALFPGRFIIPITWTGFVNGEEIEIIQNSFVAKSINDFKFSKFPNEMDY